MGLLILFAGIAFLVGGLIIFGHHDSRQRHLDHREETEVKKVDHHQENGKVTNTINNNDEKEKRVIEIEEVIDEARVRELAQELAREVVEKERAKHKEEVISMAREVTRRNTAEMFLQSCLDCSSGLKRKPTVMVVLKID